MRRWAVKRLIDIVGAADRPDPARPGARAVRAGGALASPAGTACCSGRSGSSRDGKPFTIMKFRSLTPASDLESQVQVEHQHRRPARAGRQAAALQLAGRAAPAAQRAARRHVAGRPAARSGRSSSSSSSAPTPATRDRHRVPAGITGWAQIHGLRGDTSIEERVRFDNHYIENWSLGLDREDHCFARSARCSASTGCDRDDRPPTSCRGPVRVALAPLAWLLTAVDAGVRRPSIVVAGTRAADLPAQRAQRRLGVRADHRRRPGRRLRGRRARRPAAGR